MSARRAAIRVEVRQFLQHRARSALLAALVAVPVAAIVGGATLLRIAEPTRAEQQRAVMGEADLRVSLPASHDSLAAALALLPRGAGSARVWSGIESVLLPGRRLRARLIAAPDSVLAPGGIGHGLVRVRAGRLPRHPGEVALSTALLQALPAGLGDSVSLAYGTRRVICGEVVDPEALDEPLVVRTPAVVEDRAEIALLVQGAPGTPWARSDSALRAAGFATRLRGAIGDRDPIMTALVFFFGGLGFLEAALVMAAAFAVTLRRRWREIGLLGSVGATPTRIASAMVVAAAGLAAAGAIAGVAAGLLITAALVPWLPHWTQRWTGGFEVPWLAVFAAVALGVIAAATAVGWPVRAAVRLPIRVALGARRPVPPPSRAWMLAGGIMTALAAVLVLGMTGSRGALAGFALIGGSVLAVAGLGASSPWLLGRFARGAAHLPLAMRLAVRDGGRFATRNGPVVTAVLAAMAMGVTVAVMVTSVEARLDRMPAAWRPDQLVFEGAAAESVAVRCSVEFPSVAHAPLAALHESGSLVRVTRGAGPHGGDWVATGDASLARALGVDEPAGPWLAIGPDAPRDSLSLWAGRDSLALGWGAPQRVALGVRVQAPQFFVDQAHASMSGLEAGAPPRRALTPWVLRLRAPVSPAVLERARALAAAEPGTSVDAAQLHRAPSRALYRLLLVGAMLTGLVVVLVATALIAAESEGDVHVLRTIGAPPRLLRAHAAARATYLAALGCLLAVPAGVLPAIGLLRSANIALDVVLPWRDIALTLLGLPSLTWLVSWWRAAPGRAITRTRVSAVLAAAGLLLANHATAGDADSVRWRPYTGRATDGTPLTGELGRISVPEDRARPGGRRIEIAFVRYRSTHPSPGPPLFFLEGGPGGSGVEGCAFVATHPLIRALEHGDVIGIDQRGTGLSRPDLATPDFPYSLPLDEPLTREADVAAFTAAAERAASYWRGRGVDLSAYHTDASADDVDDVRRALGLPRIVLYGSSYGSHLGLAILRRHGAHVARAWLSKVEGPDDTWKSPALIERQIDHLHARAARDAAVSARVPDLRGALHAALARLARRPLVATARRGQPDSARIVLGPFDLQVVVANALGTTRGQAGLPRLLEALARGDGSRLADLALPARRASVGSMMTLAMDCASGASAARRVRLARERAEHPLLDDAIHAPFVPSVCRACGLAPLPDAFRAPVTSDVPVLFVSGSLDARTPPENVEALLAGFRRGVHLVVEGTGHDSRELASEEYRERVQAFLRGEPVGPATFKLPFRFEPFDVP